jgi:hypothetical protein
MQAHAVAVEKPFTSSREQFEEIVVWLDSDEAWAMNHRELEDAMEAKGRELLRRLYQDHLDLRGPAEVVGPVVGSDGIARGQRRTGEERALTVVFGDVTVPRTGCTARGATRLYPLDAELNLPEGVYSHGVQRRVAEEAAKNSFDEVVESMSRHTGANVPKRQAEELCATAAKDFDAFYATRAASEEKPTTPSGSIVVVTADGKGVVMRKEDLREATRKKAETRTHKLDKRLSKGEKKNAKRMATVAAVYTVAPFVRTPEEIVAGLGGEPAATPKKRPRPEQKRVWASLEKEPDQVIDDAFEEAWRRDRERKKTWVALVDGNETQLRILAAEAIERDISLVVILDVIHVIEYLWKAALAFHAEGTPEAEQWVSERLLEVLRGHSSNVAAGIRRSATLRDLSAAKRKPADTCANYLLKYADFLHYDQYLAAGLPIASGVIEGACRHLIKDRMDLTGARWSLDGAEAILKLRALRSSGDFDDYWLFHETKEWERNHAARYANGRPPPTTPAAPKAGRKSHSHLRLVK